MGTADVQGIHAWVRDNAIDLLITEDEDALFAIIWPVLDTYIRSKTFKDCRNREQLQVLASLWINGESFEGILNFCREEGVVIRRGKTQRRKITVEFVIDICEGGLSYDGMLVLAAIAEAAAQLASSDDLVERLKRIQKRVKYGLATPLQSGIYEAGMADRALAIELSKLSDIPSRTRKSTIELWLRASDEVASVLDTYPKVFKSIVATF